jgi:uncharacterized protein (UPF0147 family)
MGIREYIKEKSSFVIEKKCSSKKEEEELEVKYVDDKEPEEIKEEEKPNVEAIIKDLGDIDWSKSQESKSKALQLLKGLVYNDDAKGNRFIKALSDASTEIAKEILSTKTESKKPVLEHAVSILDGISEDSPKRVTKESSICNTANNLL